MEINKKRKTPDNLGGEKLHRNILPPKGANGSSFEQDKSLFPTNGGFTLGERIEDACVCENLYQHNCNFAYHAIIEDISKLLMDRYSLLTSMKENPRHLPQSLLYFETKSLNNATDVSMHLKRINDTIIKLKTRAFDLKSRMKNEDLEYRHPRVPQRKKKCISPETEHKIMDATPKETALSIQKYHNVDVSQCRLNMTNSKHKPETDPVMNQRSGMTSETKISLERQIEQIKAAINSAKENTSSQRDFNKKEVFKGSDPIDDKGSDKNQKNVVKCKEKKVQACNTSCGSVLSETTARTDPKNKLKLNKDALFELRLNQLEAYAKIHGDCNVPADYTPLPELGNWVRTLRRKKNAKRTEKYRPKSVMQDHIKSLDKLGFIWDLKKWLWNKKCEALKSYKEEHGNLIVPRYYNKDNALGMWVYDQRAEYRKFLSGKPSQLTQAKITELNLLGFIWNILECNWEKKFQELERYEAKHGNVRVSWIDKSQRNLAEWINYQRKEYYKICGGKKSLLMKYQIVKLQRKGII
uniref:Helicase-associated domain-containing protein n=1 Tax=Corethron hystrix TaxID=216773 RepID=A0A7S1C0N1_9STRA|mmetsp:Transcript_6777/g.14597  ORF Transcript_6777/g.14597 Transcript_6777/m.14597 type:complete len:525 (+) Transcript_6777:170-1744(+)